MKLRQRRRLTKRVEDLLSTFDVQDARESFLERMWRWITSSLLYPLRALQHGTYSLKTYIVKKKTSKSSVSPVIPKKVSLKALNVVLTKKENKILVSKSIQTEDGTVQFQGELSQEEHDFVLQTGLTYLYEQGVLPFTHVDEDEMSNYGGTSSAEHQ